MTIRRALDAGDADTEKGASPVPHDPYSVAGVAQGVTYLISGKALTSVAGIGTFILLVRELPVEQFAAYSVLFALVELVDAVTGVGLTHVLSRYVPEVIVERREETLRRLIFIAVTLRLAVLACFLGLVYLFSPLISPLVGLQDWIWALHAYLLVVFARVATAIFFSVLESMLRQGIAQSGAVLVTLSRFALFALVASQGELDLKSVIIIELATDVLGSTVMIFGLLRALPKRRFGKSEQASAWLRSNLRRMSEFGIKGYLQYLLIMPYGTSTNRLLVGGALASGEVALFGFAQSIADLMERYLPVRLLAGVIRPVLTASYTRDARFDSIRLSANLIFKVNATLVALAAVVIYAGKEPMLAFVSAGKYSEGAAGLLLLMCALVLMFSLRFVLDHVCHAVERNGPLIWSNAIITTSVLPGILLLPQLGVYALPLANLVGLLIGTHALVLRLRAQGFEYRYDISGMAKIAAATLAGFVAGTWARWFEVRWEAGAALAITCFLCLLATIPPVNLEERQLLSLLLKRSRLRSGIE